MLLGEHPYQESLRIAADVRGAGFYPLLMAALRVSDSENFARIRSVFPDVCAELDARYNSPGGVLTAEQEAGIEAMFRPPLPDPDQPRIFYTEENGPEPGYVFGTCGHRVSRTDWDAGFRICEAC